MIKHLPYRLLLVLFAVVALNACERNAILQSGGFPQEVGNILVPSCAIPGCHDQNSYDQEGRLSLATWENMFKGSRAGAAVVPYRIDQSYLVNFINTYPELGLTQTPVMPLNGSPMDQADVTTILNWIDQGAPSETGDIMFSDNPDREKIYIVNQGCDQVCTIDPETRVVMRYIDIGIDPNIIESPHYIKISPDKRYWYVVFLAANPYIEKYDARTDELVGRVEIGNGSWNTFALTPDGQYAFAVDLAGGVIRVADVENMTPGIPINTGVGTNPHGIAFNPAFDAIYVTEQEGNQLYKILFDTDPTNPDEINFVDLVQDNADTGPRGVLGPHEVLFTPDGARYAVTCQYASQVRIYDSATDDLLETITVGAYPSELDYHAGSGLMFVTCTEDSILNAGNPLRRGSVAIIDYNTMTLVKEVYTGFQPHGVEVDNSRNLVYIANRNASTDGPAPHHTTSCGGRNGYITAIDISNLELMDDFRHELSVDPYAMVYKD